MYAVENAIIQGTKLGEIPAEAHAMHCLQDQLVQPTIQNPHSFSGNTIFCDAAWEIHPAHTPKQAGIGVFIQVQNNDRIHQLHIAAMSPMASSPLQAETFGLMLATRLAEILNVQDPHFFTDCSVLVSAAKSTDILSAPGPWNNMPLLAQIQNSPSFQSGKVAHISRGNNVKAHHLARLALKVQNSHVLFRCLCLDAGLCSTRDSLSVSSVLPFTLSVKCS